jgi:hypothetical protein
MNQQITNRTPVKMLSSRAGASVSYRVGQVVSLPAEQAQRLVACGEAEFIDPNADLVRLKIVGARAGESTSFAPGQVVRLPRAEAEALIAQGEAERMEPAAAK